MKCKIVFLFCFLYIAGASAAGTVSLTGKKVSLNAPRISIGSYIKNRGISAIKPSTSDGGGSTPGGSASQDDITNLQNSVDGLQTRVSDTESDVSDLSTQIDGLNTQVGDISSNINTVGNQVSDISSNINTVGNQVSDISSRVDTVETTVANNANDVYKKDEVDGFLEAKQNKLPDGVTGQYLTYGANGPEWRESAGAGSLPPVTEAGFYIIKVLGGGDTTLEEVGLTADTFTQN